MLAVPSFQVVSSYLISSQDSTRSTGWRSPNGLFMSSFKSFTTLNVQITITIITIMIAVIMIMMILILILIMIMVMIVITTMIMMMIIYLICMYGYTHSLEYVHSYLDYLQKLIHILTLFIINISVEMFKFSI